MKRVSILSLVLAARVWGQLTPQTLTLTGGPPSPIIIVSPQATAPFGAGVYCYWVVANYPIGHSTPSAPGCLINVGASVFVTWTSVSGANSYDVLRTAAPILPGVPANIAVSIGVSGTTLNDSFGALSSYTVNTASPASALFLLDNQNQAGPQVRLTITNAAAVNSFLLGAGGGGGGTPGGTNGQVQFNSTGTFGGFTFGGAFTLVPSTGIATLTNVNGSPGTCGDATHVCQLTTNAPGQVTSQSPIAILAGTGNAAAVVALSFSATPTFTCPSATAGTAVTFMAASQAPIVLTGNITSSTLASCTPGSLLEFVFKQDATGGRTVSMPSGFEPPLICPAANLTTKLFYKWDGANGRLDSALSDAGFSCVSETSAPPTPPAAVEYLWADSSRLTMALLNSAGNNHIMPRTGSLGDQLLASDLAVAALANGITGTTQSADDNSTKLATTAYVDRLRFHGISFSIGDPANSSALTTSSVSYLASVPFACTIAAWNLAIDAGTITVKFWKVATGTAIPTSGNSINTSGVSISSGTAVHSTTLTDFTTTAVAANDIMAMAVTAVATAKFVSGVLECDQ